MRADTDSPFSDKPWLVSLEAGVRWWEKMRLLYNVIMLVSGIGILLVGVGPRVFFEPFMITAILIYALAANLAYCLGPGVDVYLTVFSNGRIDARPFRVALFVLGLCFSLAVTLFGSIEVLGSPLFW